MPSAEQVFDQYAANYDAALNQGLSVTGEAKEYYAAGRLAWTARRLAELGAAPRRVLDFGCGVGAAIPLVRRQFAGLTALWGCDVSAASLAEARAQHGDAITQFALADLLPAEAFDLVYCNGVFHHIPPAHRSAAMDQIVRALAPGGYFAFWENNPANPGTRYVMSRIPFDRDAVLVWPREARRLLIAGGLRVLAADYRFFFPSVLATLRPWEPWLCWLPLGGQYLVLGRKKLNP